VTLEELIGQRVREARRTKDWTQEELGQRLGEVLGKSWTKITVSGAERGARRFTAVELWALARTLERPVAWFYGSPDPGVRVDVLEGMVALEVYSVALSGYPPTREGTGIAVIEAPEESRVVELMESLRQALEQNLERRE
jgi:transcriptional regulator with XRE-family HTH domain